MSLASSPSWAFAIGYRRLSSPTAPASRPISNGEDHLAGERALPADALDRAGHGDALDRAGQVDALDRAGQVDALGRAGQVDARCAAWRPTSRVSREHDPESFP